MSFITEYAAAKKAYTTALTHVKPLDVELVTRLQAFDPAAYADCVAKVNEIRFTLPKLQAEYNALAARACYRCHGTGQYQAPTTRTNRGIPVCFNCHGYGTKA